MDKLTFEIVIRRLTARHAVLRSVFTTIDGKPHMEELSPDAVDPDIQIVHREKSVISEAAMTQILRKPFNLTHELPARWAILQDAGAFRVYIVGHHIVTDGQSMTILSREFLESLNNPEGNLPPLPNFSSMHMAEVNNCHNGLGARLLTGLLASVGEVADVRGEPESAPEPSSKQEQCALAKEVPGRFFCGRVLSQDRFLGDLFEVG